MGETIQAPEGVDSEKAARLIKWLVKTEAENNKTGKFNDNEMIHKIAKQIQGDIKCL